MITITIDLSKFEDELTDAFAERVEEMMTDIFVELTSPPPDGVAVDTGAARNAFQLDTSIPLHPAITNSAPYIVPLINGSSKQSPAGWFQAAIDKHTRT